jgi:hypothetical protein
VKQCSTCGEWKEEGEFREKKNQCWKCARDRARKWYKTHRDIQLAKRYFYANGVSPKDVPPELLKAKALHILVRRKIKKMEG